LVASLTTKTITIVGTGFTACLQPKQTITKLIIIDGKRKPENNGFLLDILSHKITKRKT